MHVKLLPLTPPYPEVLNWRADLERAEREARDLLEEQVKKVEDAGGTVAGVHLREERPAEEIVALAEELGACLIVVGRRDRGRIKRTLAGGVSDWAFGTPTVPSWWCARTRVPTTGHLYRG